jgi:hypothetical protein
MIKEIMFSIGILCLLSCSSNKQVLNSDLNDVEQMNRTAVAKEVDSVKVIPVASKFIKISPNQQIKPKNAIRPIGLKGESFPIKKK